MERKEICTASSNRSIWLELPEDTFRQHLVQLEERSNAIPIDPIVFTAEEWLSNSSDMAENSYTLPLETEQQVADNFAFLAAVAEGAQSVAAVCVEEHNGSGGIKIRFAALDISLNESIKTALQTTSSILTEAASKPREDFSVHFEQLFPLVIGFHSHRILARLRSVKWEKPKYLSKTHKKPLWKDFPNLIHRVQFHYTKEEKSLRQFVEGALHELAAIYECFETYDTELSSLQHLVDASFTFSSNDGIRDFTRRLQGTRKPTCQLAAAIKSLRQIGKIASYRRVCISLLQTARTYPHLFREIRIVYLTPYKSVPTAIGYEDWAKTCHVHAEIQLAVYYDLQTTSHTEETPESQSRGAVLRPRCIGTSKWLCYLCYLFLQAHNQFFIKRTHGRLYDQWTVPDLLDYGEEILRRYRGILKVIDDVVVNGISENPEMGRLAPMTSGDDAHFGVGD